MSPPRTSDAAPDAPADRTGPPSGPGGAGSGTNDGAGLGRVARGGALNLVGAVIGAALNVAVVVLVARAFSAQAAGVFFSATSVFLILAAVANLGVSSGIVHFMARLRALGAGGRVHHVLRLAFGPVAAVSVLAGGLLFVFADPISAALGDPGAGSYLRLLAVFLPFAVLLDAALAATRGLHDMRTTVVVDKVVRPLTQLGLVGALAATGAAGLLTVAWAGPYLPAALLTWWWLRRILRRDPRVAGDADRVGAEPGGGRPQPVDGRTFWAFTLPRSLANIAQIGIQRSGIIAVAAIEGAAGAAVFTAATRFMVVGQFSTQAVQFAVQPRMTELLAVEDRAGAAALYRVSTAWLVCLTWPLFLPVIVYAPLVLQVFGAGYTSGTGVLVVISVAQLASSACGMGDLVLTTAGRTRWNLVNNLLALGANVALCLALIPFVGAVGAALAWAAAIGVRNLLPIVQLHRALGLHPFGWTWLLAVGATSLWFGLLPLLGLAVLGSGPGSLVTVLLLGGAGYLATLWRLRTVLGLEALLRRRSPNIPS